MHSRWILQAHSTVSWSQVRVSQSEPSVAKILSKLMGPEEIHIFFWEGAPRPPKSKCDRPKNLEVVLVNLQISYLSLVAVVFPFVLIYLLVKIKLT